MQLIRQIVYALLITFVVGVAAAAEKRVALVIGNSTYASAPLKNPANDAEDIAATLKGSGFEVIALKNSNQVAMKRAVREFGQKARAAEAALFYFAGHGMQVKGVNYLVPVAADIQSEADAEDQTVSLDYVLRTMEDSGARFNVAILDACRNNPFARSFRSASRGLAQVQAATGTLIAYATAPGGVAADGEGRNGIYTKHLIESIRETDGDILRVFQRVRTGVFKETEGKQTPWESISLVGDFYFRTGTPVASMVSGAAVQLEDLEQEEATRKQWEQWQSRMQADYEKTLGFAGGSDLQVRAWERFLLAWTADNPLSQQDDRLREQALVRLQTARQTARQVTLPAPPVVVSTGTGQIIKDCPECPEMVVIPAGSFEMGSPGTEEGRRSYEGPVHQVSVNSFALGRTHITRGQFAAFVNNTGYEGGGSCWAFEGGEWKEGKGLDWRHPAYAQDDSHPAVCVSWIDAKAYAQWLSKKTGKGYRLPSEAELEYALRGATQSARWWGDRPEDACGHANVGDRTFKSRVKGVNWDVHACSDEYAYTAPVGSFNANGFGLYDMIGNAWIWAQDCWHEDYHGAPVDGSAWESESCGQRVLRGGSWDCDSQYARSAMRNRNSPATRAHNYGLRLVRMLP